VISRRSLLANTALILGAPMINRGRFRLFAESPTEYSARTLDLVSESTVIDMLGLLTLDFHELARWRGQPDQFKPADFKKLKDSGITVFHPAVGYDISDSYAASSADIKQWNVFIQAHPEEFVRVDCAADLERAKALGRIGIIIGQQNSTHFRCVDDVKHFYDLGQRVSQLTYGPNQLGGGSSNPHDGGLTAYGAEIIGRMNQLGMAVDISHCADRTTLDAIECSRRPVVVTHSNCRFLAPGTARCKTDEAIKKLAGKGGVMGITLVRLFVGGRSPATIENALDHVDHIARLVGVEHVGVGTDVDLAGRDSNRHARHADLDGLQYAKKIFSLTAGLLRRNYSRGDIELIVGKNFERVLSNIWTA
jgi:membrane dipeptidase